ncbi:MAG: hypothetical protein NVS4B3_07580 [Gemmatimonadaceae bacterium]
MCALDSRRQVTIHVGWRYAAGLRTLAERWDISARPDARTLRFAPGALTGSRTGSPNTHGLISEYDFNAWQNTRLGLQYVAYSKFNRASDAYDGAGGRRASDNNRLSLSTWIAF